MGELISKATDLEQGQLMSATVAMSSLVYLQGFVRIMASGLEMHQLVKVSLLCFFLSISCENLPPLNSKVSDFIKSTKWESESAR
jgi:hypothetical protein